MRMQGSVIRAITTVFNWHMENIIQETQYLYRFSLTRLKCGEDKTDLGTRIYFKNFTSINSGGRPSYLHHPESFTRNYVANDMHFEDCYFDTYVGHTVNILQHVFYFDPNNCLINPDKKWNFTNFHMTTSRHEEGKDASFTKTNGLSFVRPPNPLNPLAIHITNMTFSNDKNEWSPNLIGWPTFNTTFTIKGLNFINTDGYMINVIAEKIEIEDLLFENMTIGNTPYMSFINSGGVNSMNRVTLRNVTDESSHLNPLFFNKQYNHSSVSIKNVGIFDSKFTNRRAIFFAAGTPESSFIVDNFRTTNIFLDGDISVIGYSIFGQINITNVHCIQTYSIQEAANYIIKSDYSSEGSAPNNTQKFQNILVEESTVPILFISKPDALTNSHQSLSIGNITYVNSESLFSFELIKMSRLSTIGSYSITLEDISFKNLTFDKESKLMYLQHQLQNPVVITNLSISDVVFAGVTIEAYETNEIYNKTHVIITNMKATNINGYSRSLLNIYKGADIEIINSEFSFIGNYAKGAVLSAGKERAVATFRN